MSLLPFDVKYPALLEDPVRGFQATHPDLRGMLNWLCHLCETEKLARPLVTCFGRTRDEQEEIYLPSALQALQQAGLDDNPLNVERARDDARARFSWHCVPKAPDGSAGQVRAMDLRYSVWSDEARHMLLDEARKVYPRAELLDHAVPGGSRHLHFGIPQALGVRPADWL